MKRTCLQENTTCPDLSGNTDKQTTCELHRVKKYKEETMHNHQLINNFN